MPLADPAARRLAGRAGAAKRHGHPDADDLARDLAEERLTAHIRRVVDRAPALRPEQVARLSTLLRPAPTSGGGTAA